MFFSNEILNVRWPDYDASRKMCAGQGMCLVMLRPEHRSEDPVSMWSTVGELASYRQCRWMGQRLVHNTVPFGQAHKRGKLLLRGIGIQCELQPDTLKADRNLL